jgi:uncharacterized protein Yka (UPF0111/DUF47 family)
MFKKFLPKEESYFEDFQEMMRITVEMGKISRDFYSSEVYDTEIFKQIKPHEKACDEIASAAIKRLNDTFITPFDREDIFTLIKKINDISAILLASTIRVNTFNIHKKVTGAGEMADIVYNQTIILKDILDKLDKYGDDYTQLTEIRKLESEADKIYRDSLKQLFQDDNANALEVIKNKEILDQLEKAADKCQTCVNVIQSILIKNS